MRLLADECVERVLVMALREAGYDVAWVHEVSPRMSDEEVLGKAQAEHRVLLTNDRGFGEKVRQEHGLSPGIIILRLRTDIGAEKVARVLEVLPIIAPHMAGHYVIVHDEQMRVIPLRP